MNANDPSATAEADGLRASLHAMWASVARSWGDLAEHVDAQGSVVARAMLDSANLQRGDRVLELACGPGGVGMAAAAIVGPDGEVVLSDIAPEMTAIAAERARLAGLTNVTTQQLDLERIEYPQDSFDKVLCREGLMLVPDPVVAVSEAHRILRPDGRAVFAVWGPRDRNPWLSVLFEAITAQTGVAVPPPGLPGPFSLEAPGALGELLAGPGFSEVDVREITTPMSVSSLDEWWSVVPPLAGPVGGLLDSLPAEINAAVRARVEAAMADFATTDGYVLPGVSIVGVGRR